MNAADVVPFRDRDTPRLWAAPDLMAARFPPPRYAVPGIIPQGLTLLAGAPKLGKSWLALGAGLASASGGRALGSIPVEAGDVLYLALEDTPRRLQTRMRSLIGAGQVPERLTLATDWPLMHDGGADRLDAWADEHPGARLVMVDTLQKVRGHSPSSMVDRYQADYAAITRIKGIADRHDVAIVVVHHTRKAESDDWLDSVSGTHGLAGAADGVMVLRRARNAAGAILGVTGRDVPEAEHALDFDAATGTWRLLDGPASDYDLSQRRRQIIAYLRDHEGAGPKAIAEGTGISYEVTRQLVRTMVDADQLDTDSDGHYFAHTPLHTVHTVHTAPPTVNGVNDVNAPEGEK